MKTHKPIPYRNEDFYYLEILKEPYEEDFEDSIGNKAIITKIDFTYQKYKKSKKQTCIGHVLYVKWYYINEYWKSKNRSKLLQKFYDDYGNWLLNDAPNGKPFYHNCSLCANLKLYFVKDIRIQLNNEFLDARLSILYPFNKDRNDYIQELNKQEFHLNKNRRKWVFDRMSKKEM